MTWFLVCLAVRALKSPQALPKLNPAPATVWSSLVAYTASPLSPGHDAASQAFDNELIATLLSTPLQVTPLASLVFNIIAFWPFVYAPLVWPGRQKVPVSPFLLASFGLGVFALAPYLAVRELRTRVEPPTDFLGTVFESKAYAGVVTASAVTVAALCLQKFDGASLDEFLALFQSQLFIHTTTLDFSCLSLLSYGVIKEDAARRDADPRLAFLALLPLYGPLVYLLVRPDLKS